MELLVAVSIMATLSATFLFSYGSFDRRVTINLLAHEIALWVHDAQVSAMSVKRARNDAGKYPGYGLHFNMASTSNFIYFADLDGDRVYDPLSGAQKCGDPTVECEQVIILRHGNTIASLCGDAASAGAPVANCASVNTANPLLYTTNVLNILFARPNPFDATIWGDPTATPPPVLANHGHVEIKITSPKGYRHTITVWSTGQVSVR